MQSNIIPEGFKDDVSSQVAAEHRYKNIIIDYDNLVSSKKIFPLTISKLKL